MLDSIASGSVVDIAQDYVNAFLIQCKDHCRAIERSNKPERKKGALAIREKYGFTDGETRSIGSKSGRKRTLSSNTPDEAGVSSVKCKNGGKPTGYGGCMCSEGYGGYDCGVDMTECHTFTPTEEELEAVSEVASQTPPITKSDATRMCASVLFTLASLLFV